jgi:hypothetical protein
MLHCSIATLQHGSFIQCNRGFRASRAFGGQMLVCNFIELLRFLPANMLDKPTELSA